MGQCQCLDRDHGLEVSTINRKGAVDLLAFVGSTDNKEEGLVYMEPIGTEASLDRDPAEFEDLRVKKVTSAASKVVNGYALTSNDSPIRMPRSGVCHRFIFIV
jgi:hypothetical protein